MSLAAQEAETRLKRILLNVRGPHSDETVSDRESIVDLIARFLKSLCDQKAFSRFTLPYVLSLISHSQHFWPFTHAYFDPNRVAFMTCALARK